MRLTDGIPIALTTAPPLPIASGETLRAAAPSGSEIVDGSIRRRVDQVELLSREAGLPVDYWARLALNNARHPTANPVPYWAALEHQRRMHEEVVRAADHAHDPSPRVASGQTRSDCACKSPTKASYAGPALGDVSPVKAAAPTPHTKTIDVLRVHAPAGHIIDVFL